MSREFDKRLAERISEYGRIVAFRNILRLASAGSPSEANPRATRAHASASLAARASRNPSIASSAAGATATCSRRSRRREAIACSFAGSTAAGTTSGGGSWDSARGPPSLPRKSAGSHDAPKPIRPATATREGPTRRRSSRPCHGRATVRQCSRIHSGPVADRRSDQEKALEERRRAPRLELSVAISFALPGGPLALTTQNLSLHGLLVTSAVVLPTGRTYEVVLHLIATGETLPCRLRPAWRKRARGGAWHTGFSFERLGRAGEGKIGKYLDLRRAHLTSFLADFPIFRPLTHRDRTLLSGYCIHHLLAKNEVLTREGDLTRSLYIIKAGMVRILRAIGGEERTVATASAGEIFGEASLLAREPHHSTIQAVIPSEVIGITGASYDYLRSQDPALAIKLAETLARFLVRRLRRTTAKLFSPGDPGEG